MNYYMIQLEITLLIE